MEEAPRKRKPEKESSPTERMDRLSHRSWRGSGSPSRRTAAAEEEEEERNWESLLGFLDYNDDEDEEEARGKEEEVEEDEDEEDETRVAPARRQRHVEVRRDCPYLDTVNRQNLEQCFLIKKCFGHVGYTRLELLLSSLSQMTGIIEKMPHALIDKEPVNPSLPDDAEADAPNNTQ